MGYDCLSGIGFAGLKLNFFKNFCKEIFSTEDATRSFQRMLFVNQGIHALEGTLFSKNRSLDNELIS